MNVRKEQHGSEVMELSWHQKAAGLGGFLLIVGGWVAICFALWTIPTYHGPSIGAAALRFSSAVIVAVGIALGTILWRRSWDVRAMSPSWRTLSALLISAILAHVMAAAATPSMLGTQSSLGGALILIIASLIVLTRYRARRAAERRSATP